MSDTVTIASSYHTAVWIRNALNTKAYDIAGSAHPNAVEGFGLTYDVDRATFMEWLALCPPMAEFMTIASDEKVAEKSDPLNTYGYEIGLQAPTKPPEPQPPVEPTAAVLISGEFSGPDMDALIAQLDAGGDTFFGFDITVDGSLHPVRQQFGGVQSPYDICTLINAWLGPYAVTTMPGDVAPLRFHITSNTKGLASTISYASPPSPPTMMDQVMSPRASTDISSVLRLTAAHKATLTQGTGELPLKEIWP